MGSDSEVALSNSHTEISSGEIGKANGNARVDDFEESAAKRIKLDEQPVSDLQTAAKSKAERKKGIAPVKKE